MRPTYEELIQINPLLASRTKAQVDALLDEIESCGYLWDAEKLAFYNAKLGVHVRTEGLDMFDAGEFKQSSHGIAQDIQDNPWGAFLRRIWTWVMPKALLALVLWLALGWLFGWKIWLLVLGGLLVCLFLFYAVCSLVWHGRLM
jgi:hypothetical protein